MRTTLLSLSAGAALMGSLGFASAAEILTSDQLDEVTAGVSATVGVGASLVTAGANAAGDIGASATGDTAVAKATLRIRYNGNIIHVVGNSRAIGTDATAWADALGGGGRVHTTQHTAATGTNHVATAHVNEIIHLK